MKVELKPIGVPVPPPMCVVMTLSLAEAKALRNLLEEDHRDADTVDGEQIDVTAFCHLNDLLGEAEQ
jgi:hypothetical protein